MASSGAAFRARFLEAIAARRSHLCVGLDPDHNRIVAPLRRGGQDTARLFCEEMVAAAAPYAVAFKPNAAFFENRDYRFSDRNSLRTLTAAIRGTGALSIYDGKRGDIGNTAVHYAEAAFARMGFDAVTLNPLMGYDAIEPFLRDPSRGAFLLCLTSNPGADDFLLRHDLYLRIAETAARWDRAGNVGLVVGATRPEYAARVRAVVPEMPLLIPGVGAQGGSLEETIDAIGGRTNAAFLINVSRAIIFAEAQPGQTRRAAAEEAAAALAATIGKAAGR